MQHIGKEKPNSFKINTPVKSESQKKLTGNCRTAWRCKGRKEDGACTQEKNVP